MIRAFADDRNTVLPFGAYLVSRNLVTPGELEAALIIQAERNPRLGQLAAKRHLLSFDKIRSIYEYQTLHGLKFGEAAVALGFLTDDEVNGLLEEQSLHHTYLGEILVELKVLTPARLEEWLEAYFIETGRRPGSLRNSPLVELTRTPCSASSATRSNGSD
jgi:hypothetical protein